VGEFGDKFRKAREKKDISLDDVSNVTKISSRMLQAIEQERFDLLPGGVFNKGFIRAYAKHLGLNDEEAVTDYLACLRQAQIDAQQVWADRPASDRPAAAPQSPPAAKPDYQKPNLTKHGEVQVEDELPHLQLPRAEDVRPPRKDYPVRLSSGFSWRFPAIGVVILVLVAALLWIRHSRSLHTEAASPAKSAASSSSEPPVTTAASSTPVSAANSSSHAGQPSTNSPSPATSSDKPAVSAKTENADDDDANDVTVRTLPAAKPAAPAKVVGNLKLIIRASETSWISVTADGQPVTHETLIAPAAFSVHGTREIVVRTGNSAGVSFLFNDQEIPAQGAESEVKTYVFDSNGMHLAANQEPAQNH